MVRVKRGTISTKTRRNILKQTKGFRWGRKSKERAAKEALLHAYTHAFNDRRKKKNDFRKLWNVRINAGARAHGTSYSTLIHALKESDIMLDRKILSTLAKDHPETFASVVKEVSK